MYESVFGNGFQKITNLLLPFILYLGVPAKHRSKARTLCGVNKKPTRVEWVCGAGGRIRTADLFITSESLCLLSHTSDCMSDYSKTLRKLQLLSIKKSSKSRSLRVLTKTQSLITKKERHCLSFVQVLKTANYAACPLPFSTS